MPSVSAAGFKHDQPFSGSTYKLPLGSLDWWRLGLLGGGAERTLLFCRSLESGEPA